MLNDYSIARDAEYRGTLVSNQIERNKRSELGQFFTPAYIAKTIARQFGSIRGTIKLLDPGAGVGVLTAAFVDRILQESILVENVSITAYEIDKRFLPDLQTTLAFCENELNKAGINSIIRIINEDFLVDASKHLSMPVIYQTPEHYTHAILNPPYGKINNGSFIKKTLQAVGINTVNLYSAFVWLASNLLEDDGEICAITPRSFCNGTYYLPFRRFFLNSMALDRIHIFESRSAVFSGDDVLQENIIFHAIKQNEKPDYVIVESSSGYLDQDIITKEKKSPYDAVVKSDYEDLFIHITTDDSADALNSQMDAFPNTLDELDLQVSTGPVVDFRVKQHLLYELSDDAVPLIYPESLTFGSVHWPPLKRKKPIAIKRCAETEKWLSQSGWYVLLKRFTSKEEKRRVVASVYQPQGYMRIGIENHVNYFHANGHGMNEVLAIGLCAFLNSSLFDDYFRQFSGHTQVNATDLRSIRYPAIDDLMALGLRIGNTKRNQRELDALVQEVLRFMDDTTRNFQARLKLEQALEILKSLSVPREQQNERSALCLLSLADIKPETDWSKAKSPLRGITEMMDWFRDHYGKNYAPNTRETIRRQTMHQFVQLGIAVENPDKPDRPINSPYWCYQLTDTTLDVIRSYGQDLWSIALQNFSDKTVNMLRERHRTLPMMPVTLPDGRVIELSAGGQNLLVKEIVEKFCNRYTPGGVVLYIGDAGNKFIVNQPEMMNSLGIVLDPHGKMPDLVVYYKEQNWLVLIEAVTSHGPIDLKRHNELKQLFGPSGRGLVFVTAFPTKKLMLRYLDKISWETEVWVAEAPDHLIHFNGERFLGPYQNE